MHKGSKAALLSPECMYTNAFYLFICNYRSLLFIQMAVCTTHQNTEFSEFLFLLLLSLLGEPQTESTHLPPLGLAASEQHTQRVI